MNKPKRKHTRKKKIKKENVEKSNELEGTTEFPKYTPGQPFGIRRNREKNIQKLI